MQRIDVFVSENIRGPCLDESGSMILDDNEGGGARIRYSRVYEETQILDDIGSTILMRISGLVLRHKYIDPLYKAQIPRSYRPFKRLT